MAIDDILNERRSVHQAQSGQSREQETMPSSSNAQVTIDLGDMSREDIQFWLQVVQTVALVIIALKL